MFALELDGKLFVYLLDMSTRRLCVKSHSFHAAKAMFHLSKVLVPSSSCLLQFEFLEEGTWHPSIPSSYPWNRKAGFRP